MFQVTEKEIKTRLAFDNPWWVEENFDPGFVVRRSYFDAFYAHVTRKRVNRAIILMGPRRVGKTVMSRQIVRQLVDDGVPAQSVLYVSLDTPTYFGLSLEQLFRLFLDIGRHDARGKFIVIFDEIQYQKNWEVQLKSLVDSFSKSRFIASGSAAAALRLKSRESGAGRFTEFLLPPLTFAEYLRFIGKEEELIGVGRPTGSSGFPEVHDIVGLNIELVNYINFGGFPEAVMSSEVREHSDRYIGSDIIDKVLLRDLPSLYGIQDVQELNRLFMTLAYNTGAEVNLAALSSDSGVAKNTIKRYLDYLEAAFLVLRIHRVDDTARRFKRATNFKVYLTNPSIRAALFGPVDSNDPAMGRLAETAIIGQWQHIPGINRWLHYARWKGGEVDIVAVDQISQKPLFAAEVKWSDRHVDRLDELEAVAHFTRSMEKGTVTWVTTKTRDGIGELPGAKLNFMPTSLYCHSVGQIIFQLRESGFFKTLFAN